MARYRRLGPAVQGSANVAAAAAILCLPLFPAAGPLVDPMATILIYGLLATGMRVVVRSAGLLDLGYAAYSGIGAYGVALLSRNAGLDVWASVPIAGALAGGIAAALGGPMVKSGRAQFALVTLAFGMLVQGEFASLAREIALPQSARADVAYYVAAATWIAAALMHWIVRRSARGRFWIAVRDDDVGASSLGLDPVSVARSAYATGAAIAGIAGALLAVQQGTVSPGDFTVAQTATVLAIVLIGGFGGQAGMIAAAIALAGARLRWPGVAVDGALIGLAVIGAALVLRPGRAGADSAKAFRRKIGAHP